MVKAVRNKDTATVEKLLKGGISPDFVGTDGGSLLCTAALNGHTQVVEVLLAAKATIDLAKADNSQNAAESNAKADPSASRSEALISSYQAVSQTPEPSSYRPNLGSGVK